MKKETIVDVVYSHFKNYCWIFLILLSFTTQGQIVNSKKAKDVALNFYNKTAANESALKSTKNISLIQSEKFEITSDDNLKSLETRTAYYIFNIGSNNGFVIVAGDERANPILGYSHTGNFNPFNIPEQLEAFLLNYKNEISSIAQNDLHYTIAPEKKWLELTEGYTKSANTISGFQLIKSSWEQNRYYNDQCPVDDLSKSSFNNHVPAGCLAVAMSQIMRFWSWPAIGEGNYCYMPGNTSDYGEQCADFESGYNWSIMPDELNTVSSETEIDAVSKLIYHSAVAVKTNFSYDGSSAAFTMARNALKNYFKYSPEVEIDYRSRHSDEEWINILKTQLDNNLPILYKGNSDNYGHAFLCDGYDSEGRFHFNWGWGSNYNGFFSLDAMQANYKYNFSSNQGAILNIFPYNEDFTADNLALECYNIEGTGILNISYNQIYNGFDYESLSPVYSYYLSEDETLDENDQLLGEDSPELNASNNNNLKSLSLELPDNLEFKEYYIFIIADNLNEFDELDEENNIVYGSFIFTEPVSDDFLVSNAQIEKNNVQSGSNLLVSCTQVYNGNTVNTINLKSGYYLSTNETIDETDILLAEDNSYLSSNNSYEIESRELNIPADIEPGKYFILFVSDYLDEYVEITEENNISQSEINITECSDFLEPNNSSDYAFFIGNSSQTLYDNLCVQNYDEDWFEVSAFSQTFYAKISNENKSTGCEYGLVINNDKGIIEIETFGINGETDTKIWLYDENLNLVAENDDFNNSKFSFLSYKLDDIFETAEYSNDGLNVYPNPTPGEIHIQSNLEEISDNIILNILDTRGALLQQKNLQTSYSTHSVDLSSLPKGEYIVALFTDTGMKQTKKIIKN